jgi:hypothetical protein
MNNGKYLIIAIGSEQLIGAFEVIDDQVHNLYGLAAEVLHAGELDSRNKLAISKLQNGYIKIVPADPEQAKAENIKNAKKAVKDHRFKKAKKQHKADLKYVTDWANKNGHDDPEFLLKLWKGL